MSIKFSCPKCDRVLTAPDDRAGRAFQCPTCGHNMRLPERARSSSGGAAADDDDGAEEVRMKACPFCDEKVRADARKCKHCGEILDPVLRKAKEDRRRDGNTNVAVGGTAVSVVVPEAPREFPHLIHAVITLFFCGAWLPVWILHYILWSSGKNSGWLLPVAIGAPIAVSCLGCGGFLVIRKIIEDERPRPPDVRVGENAQVNIGVGGGEQGRGEPPPPPPPVVQKPGGDPQKPPVKPALPRDPNAIIDTLELAGVTWKVSACVREASGITVHLKATNHKTTRRMSAGGTVWDDTKDGPHQCNTGGGELPEELEVAVKLVVPTVTRKAQKIERLKFELDFGGSGTGEFQNLSITDKPPTPIPDDKPIKVVLGTTLGAIQLSETVEIQVGEQKVKWTLANPTPNGKEESITLPKAGKYKYKITGTSTLAVAGKRLDYQVSGDGEVDVKEGSKVFYYRPPTGIDNLLRTFKGELQLK